MTRLRLLDPTARHVMLDVETMGIGWDVVVCAVGAVEFTLDGPTGIELDLSFDWTRDTGGRIDGDTVAWWLRQSEPAKQGILRGGPDPYLSGEELSGWMGSVKPDLIWTKGGLDHGAVRGWFDRLAVPYDKDGVWHHRRHRCCRSIFDIVPGVLDAPRRADEPAHSAIGDARYQVRQFSEVVAYLQLLERGE